MIILNNYSGQNKNILMCAITLVYDIDALA